ncbi:hypothetical protein M885DRAFT_252938 [Pelagophyceae sp. CCMP2097]|nr:hypothetical protein M885DRAFT_252938 [Pelagophyceae sp. CCMP2097]
MPHRVLRPSMHRESHPAAATDTKALLSKRSVKRRRPLQLRGCKRRDGAPLCDRATPYTPHPSPEPQRSKAEPKPPSQSDSESPDKPCGPTV